MKTQTNTNKQTAGARRGQGRGRGHPWKLVRRAAGLAVLLLGERQRSSCTCRRRAATQGRVDADAGHLNGALWAATTGRAGPAISGAGNLLRACRQNGIEKQTTEQKKRAPSLGGREERKRDQGREQDVRHHVLSPSCRGGWRFI